MKEQITNENKTLIDFWDRFYTLSEEDKKEISSGALESFEQLAPSEKLLAAACELGSRNKVLDLGCGNGWAAIAAAKSGCPSVTAADPAPNAADTAGLFARVLGVDEQVTAVCCPDGWLKDVPDEAYDGFICCCVLDVVPPETAEEILREAARILAPDAAVVIGLNARLDPEAAAEKGVELTEDGRVIQEGVLRLVSKTDEEWEGILSRYFTVEGKEYFGWPGETEEKRRIFRLRKKPNGSNDGTRKERL